MTAAEQIPRIVALSHGYGAGRLGITGGDWRTSTETFVRVTRREAELLRPDLLVLDAGATALAVALGCAVEQDERGRGRVASPALDPADWATWDAPTVAEHPAVVALIAAAEATARDTPTAVAVHGPTALARLLAARPDGPGPDERDDFEELVDTVAFAILDLVEAIPGASPVHLVVREDLTRVDGREAAEALRSIRRVLHHRSRRLVTWVDGSLADLARWRDAVGSDPAAAVVVWRDPDASSAAGPETLAVLASDAPGLVASGAALELDPSSDPERVQSWVSGDALAATTTKEQR